MGRGGIALRMLGTRGGFPQACRIRRPVKAFPNARQQNEREDASWMSA
jgi:hypothetical protein